MPLPWISLAPSGAPYFVTENGESWTPIGHNDAITWPELAPLFRRQNVARVSEHLAWLARQGVTVIRVMLEYCHTENRYFEKPVGKFQPNMVRFWDDLFLLCAQHHIRLLLTPFDTHWMRLRWKSHPYSQTLGGPCAHKNQWLTCPTTLAALKHRLNFVIERWGGSGALFAWDLWNEPSLAQAGGSLPALRSFLSEISCYIRQREHMLFGRSHLQTVGFFGPELVRHPELVELAFRHPELDFATVHFYNSTALNHPKNTVAPALAMARLTRKALNQLPANRPFFDSEHGPLKRYHSRQRQLPEQIDNSYFRHVQWAHLASGGAGGGLRWPYRQPHTLTTNMRQSQFSLARFCQLIDWTNFHRKNSSEKLTLSGKEAVAFGCADNRQAIAYVLRKFPASADKNSPVSVRLPEMEAGSYCITFWNTLTGQSCGTTTWQQKKPGRFTVTIPPFQTDIALAIRKENSWPG